MGKIEGGEERFLIKKNSELTSPIHNKYIKIEYINVIILIFYIYKKA